METDLHRVIYSKQ